MFPIVCRLLLVTVAITLLGCKEPTPTPPATTATLPPPYATPNATKFSTVVNWKEGTKPTAPDGFTVDLFADGLDSPRWLYRMPNGDILVAESRTLPKPGADPSKEEGMKRSGSVGSSANRITLLRDANQDGKPEVRSVFVSGLSQPFGMLAMENRFYAASSDGVWLYPYTDNALKVSGKPTRIVSLPAGEYNNHWTRNLMARVDPVNKAGGDKIYISVGSGSNVGENGMDKEERRAAILEINPDGSGERVYASGLRNPVGMDWNPETGALWTVVNERDGLGDDLVPDYMTSVREGGFYGWPYYYLGNNEDPRHKGARPELAERTIVPEVPLGSHTASLGMIFYRSAQFPNKYRNGVFIAQHGSWNRSKLAGYKVVFVPFLAGRPNGPPEDFLTGFIRDEPKGEVNGRPVGLAILADGSLLVSDDAAGKIWRVTAKTVQ